MNRIKEARIAAGLSQKQIALSLGIAGPSVSNWESGKTKPSQENLERLADLYHVSVDYLLGRETNESEQPPVTIPSVREIDDALAEVAAKLTSEEVTQVLAFIAGMKAAKRG